MPQQPARYAAAISELYAVLNSLNSWGGWTLTIDDHGISMYARGISVSEIQVHLLELCGTEVSPDLISTINDEALNEVAQLQLRRRA